MVHKPKFRTKGRGVKRTVYPLASVRRMDEIQEAAEALTKGSMNPNDAAVELLNSVGATKAQKEEAANFILASTNATEAQKAYAEQVLFELTEEEAEKASETQSERIAAKEAETAPYAAEAIGRGVLPSSEVVFPSGDLNAI